MSTRLEELVRRQPVANFYYKGSHSHPVQRQVLIIDSDRNHITGYELQEGRIKRSIDEAPIKTFSRNKIATRKQCRNDSPMRRNVSDQKLGETTLMRSSLNTLEV